MSSLIDQLLLELTTDDRKVLNALEVRSYDLFSSVELVGTQLTPNQVKQISSHSYIIFTQLRPIFTKLHLDYIYETLRKLIVGSVVLTSNLVDELNRVTPQITPFQTAKRIVSQRQEVQEEISQKTIKNKAKHSSFGGIYLYNQNYRRGLEKGERLSTKEKQQLLLASVIKQIQGKTDVEKDCINDQIKSFIQEFKNSQQRMGALISYEGEFQQIIDFFRNKEGEALDFLKKNNQKQKAEDFINRLNDLETDIRLQSKTTCNTFYEKIKELMNRIKESMEERTKLFAKRMQELENIKKGMKKSTAEKSTQTNDKSAQTIKMLQQELHEARNKYSYLFELHGQEQNYRELYETSAKQVLQLSLEIKKFKVIISELKQEVAQLKILNEAAGTNIIIEKKAKKIKPMKQKTKKSIQNGITEQYSGMPPIDSQRELRKDKNKANRRISNLDLKRKSTLQTLEGQPKNSHHSRFYQSHKQNSQKSSSASSQSLASESEDSSETSLKNEQNQIQQNIDVGQLISIHRQSKIQNKQKSNIKQRPPLQTLLRPRKLNKIPEEIEKHEEEQTGNIVKETREISINRQLKICNSSRGLAISKCLNIVIEPGAIDRIVQKNKSSRALNLQLSDKPKTVPNALNNLMNNSEIRAGNSKQASSEAIGVSSSRHFTTINKNNVPKMQDGGNQQNKVNKYLEARQKTQYQQIIEESKYIRKEGSPLREFEQSMQTQPAQILNSQTHFKSQSISKQSEKKATLNKIERRSNKKLKNLSNPYQADKSLEAVVKPTLLHESSLHELIRSTNSNLVANKNVTTHQIERSSDKKSSKTNFFKSSVLRDYSIEKFRAPLTKLQNISKGIQAEEGIDKVIGKTIYSQQTNQNMPYEIIHHQKKNATMHIKKGIDKKNNLKSQNMKEFQFIPEKGKDIANIAYQSQGRPQAADKMKPVLQQIHNQSSDHFLKTNSQDYRQIHNAVNNLFKSISSLPKQKGTKSEYTLRIVNQLQREELNLEELLFIISIINQDALNNANNQYEDKTEEIGKQSIIQKEENLSLLNSEKVNSLQNCLVYGSLKVPKAVKTQAQPRNTEKVVENSQEINQVDKEPKILKINTKMLKEMKESHKETSNCKQKGVCNHLKQYLRIICKYSQLSQSNTRIAIKLPIQNVGQSIMSGQPLRCERKTENIKINSSRFTVKERVLPIISSANRDYIGKSKIK